SDIGKGVIVGDCIATANYEFVSTGEEADYPVAIGARIPVEANTRLKVVPVTFGNRSKPEAFVTSSGGDDCVIDLDQITNGLTGRLVTKAECQCEVRPYSPLVLAISEKVVPIVVEDLTSTS